MPKTRVINRRTTRIPSVYIGRPSKWGNPYSHVGSSFNVYTVATREEAIQKYKEYVLAKPEMVEEIRKELKGKILGCYCKPLACHGDVLAEIADGEPE